MYKTLAQPIAALTETEPDKRRVTAMRQGVKTTSYQGQSDKLYQ